MATGSPSDQKDLNDLPGGGDKLDSQSKVPNSPPVHCDEDNPKSSLDFSMISSGSSSFEVLNISSTASLEIQSQDFDKKKSKVSDESGLENEDEQKLKDERDVESGKKLSESVGVKDEEDEEPCQIKHESLDGSLVVLSQDDNHNSVSEGEESIEFETKQNLPEENTTSDMQDEDGHKMETKDESLGESLVVLGPEDFGNSMSSEVSPQHITDRMIAGLMNSSNDLSHGDDEHSNNVDKTSELTNSGNQDEIIKMKEKTEKPIVKDDFIGVKKMDVSIVDISYTESTDEAKSYSTQHQDGEINRQEDNLRKQDKCGKFDEDDNKTVDSLVFTAKVEEDGENHVPTLVTTDESTPSVTDKTNPNNEFSLCGPQDSSLIVMEPPGEIAVAIQVSASDVSTTYNQEVRTNIDSHVQQTDKPENITENSQDASLSESLVVIEKDEVENALQEEASTRSQCYASQEDDTKGQLHTPTKELNQNPMKEGELDTIGSSCPETQYKKTGKTDGQPPVGLTYKVVEGIVKTMPSLQVHDMNEQASGEYHIDDDGTKNNASEHFQDDGNYQRNKSLEGSCYSTDSFCILSDSMSDTFQNSETKVNELQSNFIFTGGDLPEIESFAVSKEVTGEDGAIGLHDTNDARNMTKNNPGNTMEKENDSVNTQREYIRRTTNETEIYQMDPNRLSVGNDSESKDGTTQGAVLSRGLSLDRMVKVPEEASGGYHIDDEGAKNDASEHTQDSVNYQSNKSLEGSCYSTDSFCVLSDSMSGLSQNSETHVNELQSNFIFTGGDLPEIESFAVSNEVTGEDGAIDLHDSSDAGNLTNNDGGNTVENEKDPVNIQIQYIRGKSNETEINRVDPNRLPLANNSQMKEESAKGAILNRGESSDRIVKVSEKSENEDEADFSDAEENAAGCNLSQKSESDFPDDIKERSFDYQFPSLSSINGNSLTSFDVINAKRGSECIENVCQGASEESMEHSTNKAKAASNKTHRATVTTLVVNEQVTKIDEQKNLTEPSLGKEEKESFGIEVPSQICRSSSSQEQGDIEVIFQPSRHDQSDMIASVQGVSATGHEDEPNASFFRTDELQILQQNDLNDTGKNTANQQRGSMLDGMKETDELIPDESHHQNRVEKEREAEASMMHGFSTDHSDKETDLETRILQQESELRGHSTEATNFNVVVHVEADAIPTDYEPLSLNHKNVAEVKVETTKDLSSLEDFDLLKDAQDYGMDRKAYKNITDERTALYEQLYSTSEKLNNLDTLSEQDWSCHGLTGQNIIFQNASSFEAEKENGNQDILQRKDPSHIYRKTYTDETRTQSMKSNEDNQQVQPSAYEPKEKIYDQEEEEDDTTLTMESTEITPKARSENKMERTAENTKEALEWYDEPVTIYVLREWVEYEDQKSKIRKDQQPITKDWITIEKVKFLFDNFRLTTLLKTKLPIDTSVSYDDEKRHMRIANRGQPFSSEKEYCDWWLETIQAVFQTVGTISAYLCNLDNITRDALKELTYTNVRVISTEKPEMVLVLGTANIGSLLYTIQSIGDQHRLVRRECMREVRVKRIPEQWTRWCRHLAEDEDRLKATGILDIFTNENEGHLYVIVDKHNQLDIENVLERSSQRSTSTLEDGEYKLLSHVQVRKYIDDNRLSGINCHWMVGETMDASTLIVVADNHEIAERVVKLVRSSVKKIDLKTQGTEHYKKLEVISRQFGERMYWFVDEATRMIKVFITDDILEEVQGSIEELLGGRKSASIKKKTVTKNVHVDHYDRIKFLDKYIKDAISQLRNALQVTVTFQDIAPDRTIIKIGGEEESVRAAHVEIQTMIDDVKSFQHPNVELVVPSTLIEKVRDLEKVNRCVIATHFEDTDESDDEQLTFDNITNRKADIQTKWWTFGRARIGLTVGPVRGVEAKAIVNMMPRHLQSAEESNWKPTIFVPQPDDGKAKHDLTASFKLMFQRLSGKGDNPVAIDLHHVFDWPFQKFLKMILQAIKELWSPTEPDLGAMDIVLAVPTDEIFRLACATITPVFQENLGLPVGMVQDRPQVSVIKGDITKEQTDVIVNTAQKNLNLSHGAVSKALASRAGTQLQKECKKKYPKGIKYGQLAVTGGHELACRYIFHGAFDVWPLHGRTQMKQREILGKFVKNCLEKADELCMSSISFPAVGTGNLDYPATVVAEEMLKEIRWFLKNPKIRYLKKVRIVIYPSDIATFKTFMEENQETVDGSSVDPEPMSRLVNIGKQERHQHKGHFRVTCRAADQMNLVRKIDAILSDGIPKIASSHSKYYYATDDMEPDSSQRRTEATFQRSSDELNEDLDATLKSSRSEPAPLDYLNVASDVGLCVVVRGTNKTLDKTVVSNWLDSDFGVTPVGIAWPYRHNVCEALVTCASTSDTETILRQQNADFKATILEQQILFNVRASIEPQFSRDKREIQENSGVTVDVDRSGMCHLVGNLPQIEAANEFIVSKLREHPKHSIRKDVYLNELSVDGITRDVYNAFSFFFHGDPSYNRYKGCMNSIKYSEANRTISFDGSLELSLEFQTKLTQMKTDIICDQIDVEGRHFKGEAVNKILDSILNSQCDVHVSIPEEDKMSFQEMKVINLIGLDRNKVQAMKYQVLESVGMTSSRRNRRFDIPSFISSRKPDRLPILPPPPSAKEYYLGGDEMKVLVYEGNILFLRVDGIVNAANANLDHGGGVAGAISKAAEIQSESTKYVKRNGKVHVGTSCHTSAGNLKHYKYIIHTVGPRWDDRNQSLCEQQLQDAITSCILKAEELELESVAIPAISAGIFSMPSALCVQQYCLGVQRAWSKLKKHSGHFLKEIHFVDKNATIVPEIQKAFDQLLEESSIDPPEHAGQQIPSHPYFDKQGARPKVYHLHPFKEINNRAGIDKTTFQLSPQRRVHVYTCDILATRVDAVVCGQDKSLQCKSKIAARIQKGELSGQDFTNQMREIKQRHKKSFTEGEVVCVPIQGFDTTLLLMTVCPSMMVGVKLKDCKDGVKKSVQNILNKANEMKLHSIALPVLGSGNDVSKTGEIATVIVESIMEFFLNPQLADSLSDIHFVNHDENITKSIVKMFDDRVKTEHARIGKSIRVKAEHARIGKSIQPKIYPGKAHREGCLTANYPFGSGTDSEEQYLPKPQSDIHYPLEQIRYPADDYRSDQITYPSDSYPSERERHLHESDQDEQKKDCFGHYQSEQQGDSSQQNQTELSKSEKKPEVYEDCVICIDTVTGDNVKTLPKCKHSFHPECIDAQFKFKPVCPTCGTIYGVVTGNQPRSGTMKSYLRPGSLPGFENDREHFHISYLFPDGVQESEHPNPGKRYKGTVRTAYLPNNTKGRAVHDMLRIAFDRRLTFTIGHSRTTGEENVVTWNDIHHKTSKTGGQQGFGYPDPEYLARVTDELAAKGVTEASSKY